MVNRLLVTAFEPFGGEAVNASALTLEALPERIGGWRLEKLLLPVVFGLAGERVIARAEALEAGAVVCLGQAAGRTQVTPELLAVNLRYARIPDNAGNRPLDEPAVPGAREAYFATLPPRPMAEAMAAAGFPAALSCSAGTYVCNDTLYQVLHRFHGAGLRADFIHVPAVRDLDPAVAALAIKAGLRAVL